ncbi:MAG: GtrA family protein [Gammaproteobacteria bacterium]|nr:GtrA family protein [Gammaproteobacteria bacterium]
MLGSREFWIYFIVGGLATLLDWTVFAIAFRWLGLHYLEALIVSMGMAGCFHYVANKRLTFQCQSRQFGMQVPIYIVIAAIGLGMSMAIIAILINIVGLYPIIARMATTILMLVPNYLMHKYITFSRKIFS